MVICTADIIAADFPPLNQIKKKRRAYKCGQNSDGNLAGGKHSRDVIHTSRKLPPSKTAAGSITR
jgi:hypothetical protein